MQAIPLLLRQQLRSGIGLARTASPVRPPSPPTSQRPFLSARKDSTRGISICNRCRLRAQIRFYSSEREGQSKESGVGKDVKPELGFVRDAESTDTDTAKTTGQHGQAKETSGLGGGGGGRQEGLPSEAEGRRSQFSKQFTSVMDNLQSNVFIAGQRLNDLTGYSAIETLKRDIQAQEDRLRETRARVRDAKDAYSAAINRRSTSQREVNELLQRKHAWSPTDLERFTSLYRSDHANERTESEAQETLSVAEREAEEAAAKLSKSILARYHEEQIWSDKIRRMSTWGTWGLMGVNVLLFLIFQVAVEPWRRKRLVKGFEEKVMEALERENGGNGLHAHAGDAAVEGKASSSSAGAEDTALSASSASTADATASLNSNPEEQSATLEETIPTTPLSDAEMSNDNNNIPFLPHQQPPQPDLVPLSLDSWKQLARDLFSDRRTVVSQRDVTTVALEGAAAGAAIMGLLIALLRPR